MMVLLKRLVQSRFIKFCVIGVINTIIHLVIYVLLLRQTDQVVISQIVAFIIASLFSYWANTLFTYQEKMQKRTFYLAMLTFILKLLLNALLAKIFEMLLIQLDLESFKKIIPLFITAILLPLQFLVFNKIFEKSGELEE